MVQIFFVMILLMSVIGICLADVSKSENMITVGTFNMQKLGEVDDPDRIEALADICAGSDLLAIQEVYETGKGVENLARAMGDQYQWAVSDVTTHERFGFIWREPVQLQEPASFVEDLELGRRPFIGKFKAGYFDFHILVVHLFWDGSKKTYPHSRGVEIKLLDDWLCHRKDNELDLIMVGDFNEPNMYYRFSFPPPHSSHHAFYDLLNRHEMMSVSLEKAVPTSITNQNMYDHIIFNKSPNFCQEFAGIEYVQILEWEKQYDKNKDGYMSWDEYEEARKRISDHRPVFARFYIDHPDDD